MWHVALSDCMVAVCAFLWLLLFVNNQGRSPYPAGTLIPCLALGPVWVTGWLYGDEVGHVRAHFTPSSHAGMTSQMPLPTSIGHMTS